MISRTLPQILFTFSLLFCSTLSEIDTECSNIIKKSVWNGNHQATRISYIIIPLQYVTIHHTATPDCLTLESCSARVQNIHSYHTNDLGWSDIGFSFLIGGDGNVYEGVGWNVEGAHTYGWNKKSAGIAFIGNFQTNQPSETMLNAARRLINCGKTDGSLRNSVKIIGGRQVTSTLSPGDKLFSEIQKWSEFTSSP